MPTRKPSPAPKKKKSFVVKGDGVQLMSKPSKVTVSEGVTTVRRQLIGGGAGKRRITAYLAAEACQLFGRPQKGGGTAFRRFLQTVCEMTGEERMTEDEWRPLLAAFANRPIHGHRRGPTGGNHRK